MGFPGETEEQFQHTLDLMERVKFDNLNTFRFVWLFYCFVLNLLCCVVFGLFVLFGLSVAFALFAADQGVNSTSK